MEKRRVVITGMGTVNPLGHNIAESWQAVRDGVCGIAPITQYDSSAQKVHLAGEVKDWDPTTVIDKREVRHMARYSQFALASAKEAMADSGLDLEAVDHERCGVIVSSGIGGISTTESEQTRCLQKGFDKASPFTSPPASPTWPPARSPSPLASRGCAPDPVTACAGGSNAVGDAFRHIRDGYAEVMLCGGAEACVTPLSIGGFTSMRALHVGDDPNRASIPFDAERDGFVLARAPDPDAGGVRARQGPRRQIYAEVVGYGATCDAYHITAPAPGGEGGARAMQQALDDAGVTADQVDYINAHGTSTPLNDSSETAAIKTVFGQHAYELAVSSTKSMTGHMLGAGRARGGHLHRPGLKDGYLPATINYKVPDPACDLDYVPNTGRNAELRYALSNSLGFGGHKRLRPVQEVGGAER